MRRLENKLDAKNHQLQEKLRNAKKKISDLEKKKRDYIDLYTDKVISKEDLIELRISISNEVSPYSNNAYNHVAPLGTIKVSIKGGAFHCHSKN